MKTSHNTNYCSNEYEFITEDNVLSIDIIPIFVYSDDNKINKEIIRTRIFIPNSLRPNKTGFRS